MQKMFIKEFYCPVCKNNNYFTYKKIISNVRSVAEGLTRRKNEKTELYKCKQCNLIFTETYFNENILELYSEDNIYSVSDTYNQNELYPLYSNDITKVINKYNKKSSILEIGCHEGKLLNELKNVGFKNLLGSEIDSNAAKKATKRGFKVLIEDIFEINKRKYKFDIIISVAVLEHVKNISEWINCCNRLLNQNGTLILQFPNINSLNRYLSQSNWDMFLETGHIFFPEKKHMNILIEDNDFLLKKYFTSTILIRGKIPFLPGRNNKVEKFIKKLNKKYKLFNLFYLLLIKFLDYFYLGDTVVYVLKKKS
tara:strand:- start:1088 stop:2017 length:930 start_codon:yes stop_codon:yes gene_type:complete